jgi:hypothetical protein
VPGVDFTGVAEPIRRSNKVEPQRFNLASTNLHLTSTDFLLSGMGKSPSLPYPEPMGVNQQQPASIVLLMGMSGDVGQEPIHYGRRDLRMIANLQRHNPSELPWRVGDDIGKIAVQRQQNCPEVLGLADNRQVPRLRRHVLFQPENFMSCGAQGIYDLI